MKLKPDLGALYAIWPGMYKSYSILEHFRQSLKTHLYNHIFGYWQLQHRVTVFFVSWVQI